MDDRTTPPLGSPSGQSLRSALRQARSENAERHDAVDDLRQLETARLEMLEDAIRPIVDEAPEDAEMFDLGITQGERPRLFIDMIAFVDLAGDRRRFRFFQDTRHGRVLIAESESVAQIVTAVTNYVARRLVEREQALASDWRSRSAAADHIKTRAKAEELLRKANPGPEAPPAAPKISWLQAAGNLFGFALMTLGAITLCLFLWLIAQAGWEAWGRAFWEAHFGASPF